MIKTRWSGLLDPVILWKTLSLTCTRPHTQSDVLIWYAIACAPTPATKLHCVAYSRLKTYRCGYRALNTLWVGIYVWSKSSEARCNARHLLLFWCSDAVYRYQENGRFWNRWRSDILSRWKAIFSRRPADFLNWMNNSASKLLIFC